MQYIQDIPIRLRYATRIVSDITSLKSLAKGFHELMDLTILFLDENGIKTQCYTIFRPQVEVLGMRYVFSKTFIIVIIFYR